MAALPGAAAPRLLLIPSKAAEAPGAAAGRHLSVVLPAGADPGLAGLEGPQPARKRQRLTHLSPEEKALRRKLKNRVAAQSARDRKKARMTELEQQVVELEEENQKLLLENQLLRERTCNLVLENQELRCRLGLDALKTEEEEGGESQVVKESQVDEIRLVTGSAERSTQTTCSSAAGAGPAVTISDGFHVDSDGSDYSDSEPDLLLGFLDSLDPEMFLRCADSESMCLEKLEEEISGETNSISTSLSPSLGSPSAKLEAINELIRFDHVYTKPLILEIPVEASNQTNMLVKIEKESLSSSEDKAIPEVPVSVKEEPVDNFMPELGISHLLSSHHSLETSNYLLDACSDSGYEGSLSPFSDMSSPLGTDHVWEDSFASELFPQLISV
ncbi:LOW QUALITY PROTEIN: X-box-binding protein 1 [Chiroxiphia lanceolata]|uniref:LOW QUALITY PROTEIN: X-box-binding protein 1 n=1 Tax=Chiroxiphia lanceolata TaxID=296741 RepID=UPI0013CEE0A7|nr:LOW QUALITY PROTEIN: X-box-binding protein 1 [Chiroxiphia lanceolata]